MWAISHSTITAPNAEDIYLLTQVRGAESLHATE